MTGSHIRKLRDGRWTYPNHEELLKECGLLEIDSYIERRRGTLRQYMETNRLELLKSAEETKKHAQKILWWDQPFLTKTDMINKSKFWFNV